MINIGSRYLVNGSQLGELIALAGMGNTKEVNLKVNQIITKQFVGNSNRKLEDEIPIFLNSGWFNDKD